MSGFQAGRFVRCELCLGPLALRTRCTVRASCFVQKNNGNKQISCVNVLTLCLNDVNMFV